MSTAIIIPTRLAAVRLPNKPLLKIGDKPMIVWVAENATKAAAISDIGDVFVACADQEIANVLSDYGYKSLLVEQPLETGTDRVFYGAQMLKNKSYKYILNVQGDLPFVSASNINGALDALRSNNCDIGTVVSPINDIKKISDPNVVKAVIGDNLRALYFTRGISPYGDGTFYEHIGVYAYTIEALDKFIHFNRTTLENRERLEQLRAMENGLDIFVNVVKDVPISIDTEYDLNVAREFIKSM